MPKLRLADCGVAAAQGDSYKTLFVPRLSYEVTERKLRHEFEEFGPIKRIRLVHDRNTGAVRHVSWALVVKGCGVVGC